MHKCKTTTSCASKSTSGQANIEYAIALVGFLALIIALGAMHSFLEDGELVTHALKSSSHAIEDMEFEVLGDSASV